MTTFLMWFGLLNLLFWIGAGACHLVDSSRRLDREITRVIGR